MSQNCRCEGSEAYILLQPESCCCLWVFMLVKGTNLTWKNSPFNGRRKKHYIVNLLRISGLCLHNAFLWKGILGWSLPPTSAKFLLLILQLNSTRNGVKELDYDCEGQHWSTWIKLFARKLCKDFVFWKMERKKLRMIKKNSGPVLQQRWSLLWMLINQENGLGKANTPTPTAENWYF